jgi:hypothetical protein
MSDNNRFTDWSIPSFAWPARDCWFAQVQSECGWLVTALLHSLHSKVPGITSLTFKISCSKIIKNTNITSIQVRKFGVASLFIVYGFTNTFSFYTLAFK